MDNCQVCGKELNSSNFGIYCSASCRDCKTTNFSAFKYSIFEDNIERIIQGSKSGDNRNCLHAESKILEEFDSSLMPKLGELIETSNSKAKVWFIDILSKLNDKSAIYLLEKCLNEKEAEEVRAKAINAISHLQGA